MWNKMLFLSNKLINKKNELYFTEMRYFTEIYTYFIITFKFFIPNKYWRIRHKWHLLANISTLFLVYKTICSFRISKSYHNSSICNSLFFLISTIHGWLNNHDVRIEFQPTWFDASFFLSRRTSRTVRFCPAEGPIPSWIARGYLIGIFYIR